ncbi:unnamed protein product [Microthlaspi erraticum]|uniref:Uncharacterized protein n=1 Tax=Microthlaspi erraticum TaxID=1685480 RepID=A0A6D2JBN1_9BRAS|nr:unnamed protein product [Microthlaspi erraticum]
MILLLVGVYIDRFSWELYITEERSNWIDVMSFAVREALNGNLIEALGGGLKKSRSMAHVPRDSYVVRDSKSKKNTTTEKLKSTTTKKKTGFWTKLLHLKGKGGGADVGVVTSRQRVY